MNIDDGRRSGTYLRLDRGTNARSAITLARFHDGSAKGNWGGRATSLALAGAISHDPNLSISGVINGHFLTSPFGDFGRVDKIHMRVRHMRTLIDSPKESLRTRPFSEIEKYATRFLDRPKSDRGIEIVKLIESGDELWMNGEGDLIAGYSGSLWRCLMILKIAQLIGVPTRLVNSILSAPRGDGEPVSDVLSGMHSVLAGCESVTYRDPKSLSISERWFPDVPSNWVPDALFAWAGVANSDYPDWYGPDSEGLAPNLQEMLLKGVPLAAISGTSSVRHTTPDRQSNLTNIIEGLRSHDLEPVCVITSDEDIWMVPTATNLGVPIVGVRTPLATARRLFSRVRVLGSGRYHPAILAAGVGVPCIFSGSNSHKTASLQTVMGDTSPRVHDAFDSVDGARAFLEGMVSASGEDDATRSERIAMSVELGTTFKAGIKKLTSGKV